MHKRNLKYPQVIENQQNEVHHVMQRNENSLTLSPAQLKKTYPAAPVVSVREGRVVASSLDVARFFRKAHRTVLRCVDVIRRNDSNLHSFVPIEYIDGRGRPQRAFDITPAGFSKLVLGFRGPKAEAFRDAYVAEFQRMEAALQAAPVTAVPALPDFTNPAIAARAWADQFDRAEAAETVLQRFSTATGLIGQKRASKALGITLKELGLLLTETFRWGYRDGANRLTACVDAQNAGLLKERAGVTPAGYAYVSACLTPKALKIIAEYLCKPLTDAQIAALLTGPDAAND